MGHMMINILENFIQILSRSAFKTNGDEAAFFLDTAINRKTLTIFARSLVLGSLEMDFQMDICRDGWTDGPTNGHKEKMPP